MNILTRLKFIFFTILLSSLSYGLISCKGGKKMPEEAAKMDSLSLLLEASAAKLKAIDSAEVELTYSATMQDVGFVEENLKDSITREQAEALSTYRDTRKILKSFNKKRTSLFAEYAITEKQVKTLSADLKKGSIDQNKAYEYFVIESTEANKLLLEMNELNDRINSSLTKNKLYKPVVDSVVARIELKNNILKKN